MTIVFIWRGLGLIVPIVFGICAWIVSYWFDDTRIGNGAYMGWTSFYTAIVLLLPGLIALMKDEETGKRTYHHFMFIPVIGWSLGLGALCAYLLITADPEPASSVDGTVTEQVTDQKEKVYRTVNFLNSSEDTLQCIIKTESGSEKITVNPKSWQPMELLIDTYSFVVKDLDGNKLVTFTTDKLKEPSASQMDYESGWVQMDNGGHKLVLIDVMPMMPSDFKSSNLKDVDWTKQVVEVFDGKSFMEPKLPKDKTHNSRVLEPGDLLPSKLGTDETCYALITVSGDVALTNEYYIQRFKDLYFE